ncbi:hypothetical protein B296_00012682 [Ensete ventricosum]|uniref:Uncharacterized protein n=1 Tax=Ensete ventricosum TaxID=4639 RepID=A0A426ZVG9_ENSVE|nr:hypothetical protein B296_00012682 [Ensete ventricosum]
MLFMVSSPVSAEAGNTVPSAHNHLPMWGPTRLSPGPHKPPPPRAFASTVPRQGGLPAAGSAHGIHGGEPTECQLTATDPWGPPSLWCPVGSAQVRNPDPGPTRHHLDGG